MSAQVMNKLAQDHSYLPKQELITVSELLIYGYVCEVVKLTYSDTFQGL